MGLLNRTRRRATLNEEFETVIGLLEVARHKLTEAEAHAEQAEKAEAKEQANVADEFHGTVSPDEAMRRRHDAQQAAVAARRIRDHAAEVVKHGEQEAVRILDQLHETDDEQLREQIRAEHQRIEQAQLTITNAQVRIAQLNDKRELDGREHQNARLALLGKDPINWDEADRRAIMRYVEGVRLQAAGVDPLPPRLQPLADARIERLKQAGVSPAYIEAVLAVGGEKGHYGVLPRDGRPQRLPESFQQ